MTKTVLHLNIDVAPSINLDFYIKYLVLNLRSPQTILNFAT